MFLHYQPTDQQTTIMTVIKMLSVAIHKLVHLNYKWNFMGCISLFMAFVAFNVVNNGNAMENVEINSYLI
jgi:hypothetical protein